MHITRGKFAARFRGLEKDENTDRETTMQRTKRRGWSVGRISCLVSFTVLRCVMTVEWIIISLSFRSVHPFVPLCCPRHTFCRRLVFVSFPLLSFVLSSPSRLLPAVSYKKTHPTAGRSLSPPSVATPYKDMQSRIGHEGGWLREPN